MDASAGDVKKQVGNTVKALNGQYRFQTMGEYRALLSLYNMTVEEARGNVELSREMEAKWSQKSV